jgi:nitrate/TMAO reductase-like tetraheme cytochrome c subunit
MKLFLILAVSITALFSSNVVKVDDRYQKSQNCKACHMHIVKEWEQSWHAKSHYESDEYFRATIDYVSKKTRKSLNSVKVKCATCHNPRIAVTNTDTEYEVIASMNLDKNSAINSALSSDSINEGINCVVCHNIDYIHDDKGEDHRGLNRVKWTESGTMTGPFDDAKSPYHKTKHRKFMDKNPNQLCFVCHANDRSSKGLVFTNMQSEYIDGSKTCVECHMGPKKKGVASTYKSYNGKAKERLIREHKFPGAHIPSMWKDALTLGLWQKKNTVVIEIKNPQPHNIPSGFGSRELIVEIVFKNAQKEIKTTSISLTTHYTRRKGKATIPHMAEKASTNMSIPAKGKKIIEMKNVAGATSLSVKVYYRLVNDEVRSILKLKDEMWSNKTLVTSNSLKLK